MDRDFGTSPERSGASSGKAFHGCGKLERHSSFSPATAASASMNRGLDSWPARITAAEALLNDYWYGANALKTIFPALDYGAHPLAPVPGAGEVRRQAALALGKLKAEYRDQRAFERLQRLLKEDRDPEVLDGAFNALLSLAGAPELA